MNEEITNSTAKIDGKAALKQLMTGVTIDAHLTKVGSTIKPKEKKPIKRVDFMNKTYKK